MKMSSYRRPSHSWSSEAAQHRRAVHFNGFNGSAQGTETWHYRLASNDSKALATLVQTAMQKATGLKDRGVKSSGFGVLRPQHHAPGTAACLLEVSFMDVAAEEARLRTDAYKDKLAFALASAIKGSLVADGRMPAHAQLGALRTARFEGETGSEDGFEELLLEEALTGERVS